MLGQLCKILDISDSEAGLKVEKSRGVFGEEGECGDDDDVELLVRERRSLDILSVKKEARLSARALAEVKVFLYKLYYCFLRANVSAVYQPFRPCSSCTYLHCTALCYVCSFMYRQL